MITCLGHIIGCSPSNAPENSIISPFPSVADIAFLRVRVPAVQFSARFLIPVALCAIDAKLHMRRLPHFAFLFFLVALPAGARAGLQVS